MKHVKFNKTAAFISYPFRYRMSMIGDLIWFIYPFYCLLQILRPRDLYKLDGIWYKIIYWDGKSWCMMPLFSVSSDIISGCFDLSKDVKDNETK